AGANHNGDLTLAKEMVDAAQEIGADCIKFQTFTAEEFCADRSKTFTYRSQGKVVTESEDEMFKRLEFPPEQWATLMEYCDTRGIMFLTTVQDPVNLDMMLKLGLKGIKVGSDDFDHVVNLRTYVKSGLPLILSKGMADEDEVRRTVGAVRDAGNANLAILHCVSLYPCDPQYLNLSQISTLRDRYPDIVWGFSDHSSSVVAPALAVSLGARIIEKHFTLDHQLPGPDHWFSMDVEEMSAMISNIRFTEAAMGRADIMPSAEEMKSRKIMRRRILARDDLKLGTVLNESNVTFKRAETGAFAGAWDSIAGRRLTIAKSQNDGISEQDVETP
ncbi:MAG: N-acetylneuraminate synthase family protein, partial [Ferrovibrio sp.]